MIAYSENDSEVQVFNTETEAVLRFRLDSNTIAKNGALDPLHKYLAITSTDGHVSIFTMPSQEDDSKIRVLIKKVKITKAKVETFGQNPLEIQWTHDGSHLLVSGENSLGIISRDTWEINYSKDFGHKKPITCISWISEAVLVTAGLDKIIKIYDFSKRTLLHYI